MPGTHIRWREAVVSAKGVIESREVAEPDMESECSDRVICIARIGQQAMHAGQPLPKHILGKRSAVAFEQLVDMARANSVAEGQSSSPYVAGCESFRDISLNRS